MKKDKVNILVDSAPDSLIMSSRALRKLQKQQELQATLKDRNDTDEENESDDHMPARKINAFDLLNSGQAAEDENDSEEDTHDHEEPSTLAPSSPAPSASASKKKKQKKKKKRQAKKTTETPTEVAARDSEFDEIDQALKELSTKDASFGEGAKTNAMEADSDSDTQAMCALLAVEPKKLSAINEMKKLFGSAAVEGPTPNEGRPANRRRDRNRRALDLGSALMGQYSPASRGRDLSGVALRKNVLMQGKDEWPRATSGGLGMEVVQKLPSGVSEFELVHNLAYRDVQRQFDMCVESMQPERMIELLQFNRAFSPKYIHLFVQFFFFFFFFEKKKEKKENKNFKSAYFLAAYHLSTLLQVSEIAKHQGDHAVSADLLERALFNIGRSAQSSFGNCLKEGKARMDFTIKENRELWLAGWRYITNLGMKGTWKTAYEWAKLLLSLDPEDPYRLNLLIDQLSIRGREHAHFVGLCSNHGFKEQWAQYPNIQCTLALAYLHLGRPQECRSQLRSAISRYPWIFCRLAQELNISPVPKSIWGSSPPNQAHELFCELYIARAKDIWNTPEAISVVVEVADSITNAGQQMEPPEITENVARHVLLSDIPSVTTHLPREFTDRRISSSDPLPPGGEYNTELPPRSMINDVLQLLGVNRGEPMAPEDQAGYDSSATDEEAAHDLAAEEYIYNEGLDGLREFVQINGVDPGNWEEDMDALQVRHWVERLRSIRPNRWHSIIEDVAEELDSPLVSDLLFAELQRQTSD